MSILKLKPVLKNYIWGGNRLKKIYNRNSNEIVAESWELSIHHDGESIIEGGKFNGQTLAEFIKLNPKSLEKVNELPILIKYIDAGRNLSVQVHPDDEYSKKYENDNGKTEMWYIISAKKNAGIYCGLNEDLSKEEFKKLIFENKIENALNFVPVKAGDCFLIEAGTLHAIGEGVIICEVQQSSNVTYRVYDYGRVGVDGKPRQLHIEKAIEVTKLNKFKDNTGTEKFIKHNGYKKRVLTKCKYFICNEVINKTNYNYINEKSYAVVNIIKGSGKINNESFTDGDTFFIPCNEKVCFTGLAKIIVTSLNI
jgi:mannose-6-phosphate isomerase